MTNNPIILISGGTGVGTSTYSFELAKAVGIPTVISTDWIREIIRSTVSKNLIPHLDKSSYMAGKTDNYSEKNEDVQKSEIIRAFKNQAISINSGVEGVITRSNNENIPIIIEGVHLIPGKIKESAIYEKYADKIFEFFIYIQDEELHKTRFLSREKNAPERSIKKYIDNFKEIRWIQEYLMQRSNKDTKIIQIDNSSDIRSGLDKILQTYYSKIKR
jgi:2-phosphoglycerate kinase